MKNEEVDRGWREISGVSGPLLEEAEMSDDGPDCRQQVTAAQAALPYAVYTAVQMLEIHPPKLPFLPLFGTSGAPCRRQG
jgi:hypothetical protein